MIAQTFYRRCIIERWGRGTLKIARLMREAGLEPPVMTLRTGAVVLTFDVAAALAARGWQKGTRSGVTGYMAATEETPGKTPELILALLREQPDLSLPHIAAQIGKSGSAVERAVRKLRESGRLQRVGPDKGGHWQVVDNNNSKE